MSEPYGILTMSQFEEIYKVIASKDAEIARLRLTDEEREAIEVAISSLGDCTYGSPDTVEVEAAATLRSMLARLA
jgi:hypothetical protein